MSFAPIQPVEFTTPVVTVKVYAHCTTGPFGCTGKLVGTGGPQKATWPPLIPHKCDVCGTEAYISGKEYPYIRHDEVTV